MSARTVIISALIVARAVVVHPTPSVRAFITAVTPPTSPRGEILTEVGEPLLTELGDFIVTEA